MPVGIYKSLGDLIKNERKKRSLTQQELGTKVGVSGSHVSKWERDENKPDDNNIGKLATALLVPKEVLLNKLLEDEYGYLNKLAEPMVVYGDRKMDIIKNLEAIQHLAKITIDQLKKEE